MQHSILFLFNPNDFVNIRNKSTQTKNTIFSDFFNLKKNHKQNKSKYLKLRKQTF